MSEELAKQLSFGIVIGVQKSCSSTYLYITTGILRTARMIGIKF